MLSFLNVCQRLMDKTSRINVSPLSLKHTKATAEAMKWRKNRGWMEISRVGFHTSLRHGCCRERGRRRKEISDITSSWTSASERRDVMTHAVRLLRLVFDGSVHHLCRITATVCFIVHYDDSASSSHLHQPFRNIDRIKAEKNKRNMKMFVKMCVTIF